MILICGLGNPGEKYAHTRHNVGWLVVDALAGNIAWEYKKKLQAKIAKLNNDVVLAQPQTYMNRSGDAVQKLTQWYKRATNLWIIHDDIDLPLGVLRIKTGGGSAGHRGVQSIIDTLGTDDFVRFRCGIGRGETHGTTLDVEEFVLLPFAVEEKETADRLIATATQAVRYALDRGVWRAMHRFN